MEREEAIRRLDGMKSLYPYENNPHKEAIDMAIEALQTDEVLCKDCKWYKKIVEKSKSGLCHYDLVARCLHDEDYCSHGERREL